MAAISGALRDGRPRQALHAAALLVDHEQQRRAQGGAAAGRAAASRVSARTCAGVPRLAPRKMTPAASPRRMRAISAGGAVRPAKGKMTCWPASWASVSAAPDAPRGARRLRAPACAALGPLTAGLAVGAAGDERQGDGGERGGPSRHRAKLISAVRRCAAAAMSFAAFATSSRSTISTGECM